MNAERVRRMLMGEVEAVIEAWRRSAEAATEELLGHEAIDILALAGALRRLAPGDEAPLRLLDETVSASGGDIVRHALAELSPQGWVMAAERLPEALDLADSAAEWVAFERASIALFCDLDDADLVAWNAAILGQPDRALEEGLIECFGVLGAEPELFAPVAPLAAAYLMAADETLWERDPVLDRTLDKHRVLRDLGAGEPIEEVWLPTPLDIRLFGLPVSRPRLAAADDKVRESTRAMRQMEGDGWDGSIAIDIGEVFVSWRDPRRSVASGRLRIGEVEITITGGTGLLAPANLPEGAHEVVLHVGDEQHWGRLLA